MEERLSLEQAINSDARIAVLETANTDHYIGLFKRLTLTTGRAVYDWNPEHGLYRLGIEHIFIPRTRTPADVLAYISSSRHYGIYLLRNFVDSLNSPAVQRQLAKLMEKQDKVKRQIFLLGERVELPSALQTQAVHISTEREKQAGNA